MRDRPRAAPSIAGVSRPWGRAEHRRSAPFSEDKSSDYDEFIKNSLNYGIQFSNKLFIILFNESFIEL